MKKIFLPNHIPQCYIYDVLHNEQNEFIIIMALEIKPLQIEYCNNNIRTLFNCNICPHNHTCVYNLTAEYKEIITLVIDGMQIETNVNKYPVFKDEIIFSTMVKNEDSYIKQWIDFHFHIGITRFIIYDNSDDDRSNLPLLLQDYITKSIVLLIKWSYPKRLPISGISGQTTQQNHSIYAFQNSKYIGLFDIDEYVNIQHDNNINELLEHIIKKNDLNITNISSIRLLNKFFYNPHNMPTDGNNFFKIVDCMPITKNGREKNFVIPKNVITFSIHVVTSGLPMFTVDEKEAYFNHYYFLNKSGRGKKRTTEVDTSILRHLIISLN